MTPMSSSDARKRLRESVERLETRDVTYVVEIDTSRLMKPLDGLSDYIQRLERERAEREFRANPPAWTRPPFRTRAHWIDPPRFTVPDHLFTQEDDMNPDRRDEAGRALAVAEGCDVDAEAHLGYASSQAHALLAIHDLLADRLPKPADTEADEPEPTDLTEEPPVGSRVVDCDGDVWERRLDGDWDALTLDDEEMWGMSWEWVRRQAPLRLTTPDDLARVGIEAEPAPADDPDEAHPLPCNACYGSGSAEIQEQVAEDVDRLRTDRDEWRAMAREADADSKRHYVRAVKAEAERNALKSIEAGIEAALRTSREMQAEQRSSVTLAFLQGALDDLLDPTEGETSDD